MQLDDDLITVAIYMITYNHENYIEQAVESVMMQQSNFRYKLFIGEDCSTDKTAYLCEKLRKKYSSKIEVFLNKKNIGANNNAKKIFTACFNSCAKYVAILEGDDYWTDHFKLQKQVDFLETNNKYSYCAHKSNILNNHLIVDVEVDDIEINFENLILKNPVNTASLLFRKSAIDLRYSKFSEVKAGDWYLQFIALKSGLGYIMQDCMSVYRIHDQGIWSNLTPTLMCERGVEVLEAVKLIYNDKHSIKLLNDAIVKRRSSFGIKDLSFHQKLFVKLKTDIKKFLK